MKYISLPTQFLLKCKTYHTSLRNSKAIFEPACTVYHTPNFKSHTYPTSIAFAMSFCQFTSIRGLIFVPTFLYLSYLCDWSCLWNNYSSQAHRRHSVRVCRLPHFCFCHTTREQTKHSIDLNLLKKVQESTNIDRKQHGDLISLVSFLTGDKELKTRLPLHWSIREMAGNNS